MAISYYKLSEEERAFSRESDDGSLSVYGHIVDPVAEKVIDGRVVIGDGLIQKIEECAVPRKSPFLVPGFVDAHVHIESSLLPPVEFGRAAVVHGTVATVSDPHEIANVLGLEGVRWMLESAEEGAIKIHFGAPSCVPATPFETAGAALSLREVKELLDDPRINHLAEVMNFPGVLAGQPALLGMIAAAQAVGKPVDGHAPGLRGGDLRRYAEAGIQSDHECCSFEEGRERLEAGMKLAIREGSAARNFEALAPLLKKYQSGIFFCSDDKHPDSLEDGHINVMCRRAVALGHDFMRVLRAATVDPVRHYKLRCGLLREGDPADMVELDSLRQFGIRRTWIDGRLVAEAGRCLLDFKASRPINQFRVRAREVEDFAVDVPASSGSEVPRLHVIVAEDGQIATGRSVVRPRVVGGKVLADPSKDQLKLAVINRYVECAPVACGFVSGFGLQAGALASSVAHDSHNIVVVGTSDEEMCRAANLVIAHGGGLAVAGPGIEKILPLPCAGLMSVLPFDETAMLYKELNALVGSLGSKPQAPFMLLSFLALPVIPRLKLTDRGLFDVDKFAPINLWVDR